MEIGKFVLNKGNERILPPKKRKEFWYECGRILLSTQCALYGSM